eukprot:COSAG02_NODE_36632_length_452_cov_1.005666_1_plen_91_part_01
MNCDTTQLLPTPRTCSSVELLRPVNTLHTEFVSAKTKTGCIYKTATGRGVGPFTLARPAAATAEMQLTLHPQRATESRECLCLGCFLLGLR